MELTVFNFDSREVRTILREGEPWFFAKDVADVLGYGNTNDAILRHCKGVAKHDAPSSSGIQTYSIIPERDVYRLVMRSKLPSAERFEEWVVGEVLPSIRKTGNFSLQVPQTLSAALFLAAEQAKQIEEQQTQIATMQPKADFYDAVTESTDAVDLGTVAKVLNLGIGRTRLFEFLRNEGILMANNRPMQRHIDEGHFRVIETSFTKPDGSTHVYFKTVAFQKGIDFIRKRYLAKKMEVKG